MKDRVTKSPRRPSEEIFDKRPVVAVEERRTRAVRWMILIGAILAVISIGSYVPLCIQTGAWQVQVIMAGIVLGMLCLIPAYRLVLGGKLDAAGYWILAVVVIIYGVGELVWADATVSQTASVILLMIIVSSVLRPHRWYIWLSTAVLYLVYVLLINQFEPLPRYPILSVSPATQYINIPLVLLVLWQFARVFRIGTIRARLLISFVALALLLATLVGASAVVTGFQSGRRQVITQLDAVAALKESEINAWVGGMQRELTAMLFGDETSWQASVLLGGESPDSVDYQIAHNRLLTRFQQSVKLTGSFEKIFLIDLRGRIVLSTDPAQEGQPRSNEIYFQRGLGGPYVLSPFHSPLEERAVVFAQPVRDQQGEAIGVLAGQANLDVLNSIMLEQAGLGGTGETYLVSSTHIMVTTSRFAEFAEKLRVYVRSEAVKAAIDDHTGGSGLYEGYRGVPVVGAFRWLPDLQMALLAEQDQREAFAPMYLMLGTNAGVALLSVLLAVGASLLITRSISAPLSDLVETAAQIAAGDLERVADVRRRDEIGALAQAFNSMTAQLRQVIGGLEQRVAKRTRELELRASYQDASAEVGRAITSILDADQLISQVVDLILEQFDLYYVGLFLVDEAGEWAVLHAGSGEAGRAMLARGHRLRVGQGMIGWSIANAQARVALKAEADAVRRVTTELPDTRSEAALPLRSRGQVIGALTVQSDRPGVFDEATVAVLQTMADQVAVALDNARLFTASQAALDAARAAYGEMSRESWGKLLGAQPDLVYRGDAQGIARTGDVWRPEMERALQGGEPVQIPDPESGANALAVPIKVRGSVIGVLDTYKPAAAGGWTAEEIALLETLTDQLGVALEGARLYQEAQRRAARESLTGDITDRMRRAPDVEGIVQAAVDELFAVLGTSRAFVRLETPTDA